MLAYYKVSMEPALYYVLQKLSVQHGKLYLPSDLGDRTSPAAVLLQKAPEYFLALSVRVRDVGSSFPTDTCGISSLWVNTLRTVS